MKTLTKKKSRFITKCKLDPSVKEKWVKALRSGEFKQGTGNLFYDKAYCCLGVVCKLSGISDDSLHYKGMPASLDIKLRNKLPNFFRQNPEDEHGNRIDNNIINKLAGFNDEGKSFNWIAGYIERYL